MPELHFKGKEYVFNHHLTVPHRPLVAHPDKSAPAEAVDGDRVDGGAEGNLIIHGDNLHALKALLPRYAGKVDCIFIDPPYNTGNENWNYNDNVNSPILREWLDGNPVNKEDMLRHDKWCCMMYPRLKLLHELLSEQGSFWMTLDDNEIHRARMILDEIFGEENFVAAVTWRKRYTRSNNAKMFYSQKDYVLSYRKSEMVDVIKEPRTGKSDSTYSNSDNDPKGPWITASYVNPATKEKRKNLVYSINNPFTKKKVEHPTHAWKYGPDEHTRHVVENRLWWGADGNAEYPRLKLYLKEAEQLVPVDFWDYSEVGSSDDGGDAVKRIFGQAVFDNPKPVDLIKKILALRNNRSALILDSFAGSATTGHAVLAQNAKDGGNRRFILVECEDYADTLTAERVRRVINGYEYQGIQKEELLREKITWSNFSRERAHRKILDQVQAIENLDSSGFETIRKTIKDGELIVTGENRISEKVEGLGGGFTYYTLGDPLDLDKLLTGESLPDYASIGAWLFHTATGEPLAQENIREENCYLGESAAFHVWLIYRPILKFLKSRESALTLDFAEKIAKRKGKRHLVFASSRFVSNKTLFPLGVEFAPLPFALYRLEME
ncbi:MAG: site-specific DNA-methyltransferase [Gammaproteobacteria bacterium]|nr:site-specific DNA-methyltransferase [Gammaproteobacteria bacterium]MXX07084.1 site-specific DNA-methyltransferase [Gammaproteobacteria bacterium]MYC58572.1 site-specific DNA-methyltransferase [Gammaproteobacteria bacterium]MYE30010.1 site-specific DNA-methyltransferase [Gammaproteobacteria bacterium]